MATFAWARGLGRRSAPEARRARGGSRRRVGVAPLAVLPLLLALSSPARAEEFTVIVHPGVVSSVLSSDQASRLFLKKETRWPDGTLVKPVVLADQQLRDAFCRRVHHRTASAVHAYWYQMIFSGNDVPPPERQTASEVVEYVRRNPGAIGYVPAETPLAGVRAVALIR